MDQRALGDLSIGLIALSLAALFLSYLESARVLAPKVLADSVPTCTSANECTGGTKTEGGFFYYCSGPPDCKWIRQTIDPPVPNPQEVCCLGNGQFANCVILSADKCIVTARYPEAVFFSGPTAMTQCNRAVMASGRKSCMGTARSSASSRSSSSAPLLDTWCGDNVIQKVNGKGEREECDWGTGNSDLLPNKCRKNCRYPTCGDRKVDDNFFDRATNYRSSEECDNVDYVIEGTRYPAVSDSEWAWNAHGYCNSDCTIKTPESPLYYMFESIFNATPLYLVRPAIDWNSIFFPFSSLTF
jgi:hypothetical protein